MSIALIHDPPPSKLFYLIFEKTLKKEWVNRAPRARLKGLDVSFKDGKGCGGLSKKKRNPGITLKNFKKKINKTSKHRTYGTKVHTSAVTLASKLADWWSVAALRHRRRRGRRRKTLPSEPEVCEFLEQKILLKLFEDNVKEKTASTTSPNTSKK